MNTVQMKNPFASREKTPTLWYSHQCTPTSHHSRCTLTTNKIAPLVLCKSIHIHFHHFTSSRPPPPEKTPKAMADKKKQPLEENSFRQRSEPFESNLFFSTLSLVLIAIS
jgi:hypothetical protein